MKKRGGFLIRLVLSVVFAKLLVMLACEYIHPLQSFSAEYPSGRLVLDASILILVMVFVYLRYLKRPMDALSATLVAMGKGDLFQRARVDAKDEFCTMAIAFNEMAEELQGSVMDMERQVLERTEKLNRTQRATLNILEDLQASKVALEKNRLSFINIVEKSVDGVLVVCRDGVVRFVSPSAACMFGTEVGKMVGTTFDMPVSGGQASEVSIIRTNGEAGVGELRTGPTEWDGRDAQLVHILDITERKKMEEELIIANANLKRMDKLKDEFVSIVSHELRTPLAVISESVGIVQDEVTGKINPEQAELLNMCRGNIERLTNIINDLLDISKIEAGKIEIRKAVVNMADLVRGVCDTWNVSIATKNKSCTVIVPERAVEVRVDIEKITQVLNNLISNALRYAQDGQVAVELRDRESAVDVSVSNTGVGIDREDLPLVFGKFRQFKRTVGAGPHGTGLGLAICKNLVELHKGTIRVESEPGKVTRFTFTLPMPGED